jgi:hypothetical protein
MEKKTVLKEKFRKQISGKFNNIDNADENKREAEIQCFLHTGQISLGYFLARFQYLHLP